MFVICNIFEYFFTIFFLFFDVSSHIHLLLFIVKKSKSNILHKPKIVCYSHIEYQTLSIFCVCMWYVSVISKCALNILCKVIVEMRWSRIFFLISLRWNISVVCKLNSKILKAFSTISSAGRFPWQRILTVLS